MIHAGKDLILSKMLAITFCATGKGGWERCYDLRAKWIYHPEVDLHKKAALMFRKRVQMDQPPKIARIFVSADSRYKLYVNGSYVGNGPLKGDPYRQFYETFDISQYLIPGENVIAAYVLRFPPDDRKAVTFETGPVSLVNNSRGGFFLQGESGTRVYTDESWKQAWIQPILLCTPSRADMQAIWRR